MWRSKQERKACHNFFYKNEKYNHRNNTRGFTRIHSNSRINVKCIRAVASEPWASGERDRGLKKIEWRNEAKVVPHRQVMAMYLSGKAQNVVWSQLRALCSGLPPGWCSVVCPGTTTLEIHGGHDSALLDVNCVEYDAGLFVFYGCEFLFCSLKHLSFTCSQLFCLSNLLFSFRLQISSCKA